MLDICYYGDAVLKKKAAPVETFDDELAQLALDMIETMREEDGVGLAAPQIGLPLQLIVVDAAQDGSEPYVLVNPKITFTSEETVPDDEGCLSLPGITVSVTRPATISVSAQNVKGESFTIENAADLLARALQHEIDHLNGVLLIDHVSPAKRIFLKSKLKKNLEAMG